MPSPRVPTERTLANREKRVVLNRAAFDAITLAIADGAFELAKNIIASVKATLVLLYFMHVRFESRLVSVMVFVAIAAFAVFMILMFSDIFYRYG